MNFSAASSSSSVVTPGRALASSICRQRTRISPAAAIWSTCSGVLRMIIRYTLGLGPRPRSPRRPPAASSPGCGGSPRRPRPGRASPSIRRSRRCAGRSSRPAARSSRGTCSSRLRITSGLSSSRTISSLPSMSQTPSCLGGLNSTWKTWPFSAQVRRPPSRRTTSSSETSISSTAVTARPSSSSFASSASACGVVRGKPSRMKPSRGLGGVDPLGDHADDHLVGDEVAAVHVLLGRAARARSRRAPRRAGCRRSRSRAGAGLPAAARPGCPCPTRAGRAGLGSAQASAGAYLRKPS